jgi:hypothetical protein
MSFFHREEKPESTDQTPPEAVPAGQLSAESTVKEWLEHPVGGAIFRSMLKQAGQNESVLRIVHRVSLKRLVDMSKGQFSEEPT